jgi:hypothetical protein
MSNQPIDVICGECSAIVGRAFPDDAEGVFRAHLDAVHPKLARGVKMTEDPASIHIPWPPVKVAS